MAAISNILSGQDSQIVEGLAELMRIDEALRAAIRDGDELRQDSLIDELARVAGQFLELRPATREGALIQLRFIGWTLVGSGASVYSAMGEAVTGALAALEGAKPVGH